MSHPQPLKFERISITIDEELLARLDNYTDLQKTANKDKSRANIICSLIRTHIPS